MIGLSGIGFPQPASSMQPIRKRWHLHRWQVRPVGGDCMRPTVPEGVWALIDRAATIRPGDLVVFALKREHNDGGKVMGKRFTGLEDGAMCFEVEHPQREAYALPIETLEFAYRVRRYLASPGQRHRAVWEIMRNETLHNEHLGRVRFPADWDFRTYSRRHSE